MIIAYSYNTGSWHEYDLASHSFQRSLGGCVLESTKLSVYRRPLTSCPRGHHAVVTGEPLQTWPFFKRRIRLAVGEKQWYKKGKPIEEVDYLIIDGPSVYEGVVK